MEYKKSGWNQKNKEYSNFRVKSPIKSFRDLEVYQKTIQLSEQITSLDFLSEKEVLEIKLIAENIPKLIAEAWGDKFDSKELADKKITFAVTLITNIITKIDLLREKFSENLERKESLDKLLVNYLTQKRKALNLRSAWQRVFEDKNKS